MQSNPTRENFMIRYVQHFSDQQRQQLTDELSVTVPGRFGVFRLRDETIIIILGVTELYMWELKKRFPIIFRGEAETDFY